MSEANPTCEVCGEPMPKGEEMFKFHGYSGPCPKPPLSVTKTTTSTAWVIENRRSKASLPEYFTGSLDLDKRWSAPGDHSDVCRFARRVDAERMAQELGGGCESHRIAEHSWEE